MNRVLIPASTLFFALLVPFGLTGCPKKDGAAGSGSASIIKIDGSSTVFPVTEAVAEEFQKSKKNAVKVTVGISGTGGGFKKFVRGETDISDASRPILKEEIEQAKTNGIEYLELPICFDALTVTINPQNTWAESMTIEDLKKIWEPAAQGKTMKWNQVRSEWPDESIQLFGAGADSGTFDYFTEAIVGKAKSSRSDYTASEDDNVLVTGVEKNKGALGYFGFAYYEPHKAKMKAVKIAWAKNKVQEAVAPSMETVLNGTYNPLSRPLFIYVSKKSMDRAEVREFVDYYLKNVEKLAKEVKYMPLPSNAYTAMQERFTKREYGTAFGGVQEIGLPIDDIIKRTPKN